MSQSRFTPPRTPVTSHSDLKKLLLFNTGSEQIIQFRQRQLLRRLNVCQDPVCMHCIRLWIDSHLGRRRIPLHVLFLHRATALHRLEPPRQLVACNSSRRQRYFGHECHRVQRCRCRLGTPHWPRIDWLNGGNGCIRISHLRRYQKRVGHVIFKVLTCAHAITPDFRTISGFVPKFSGFQRTKSARVPTAM